MKNFENLVSLPVERNVLAGLLKFPDIFAEVDVYLTEIDFYNKIHQTIYCVIKSARLKNEELNRVLLSQKLLNLSIVVMDDINILDYITTLYETSQINVRGTLEAVKELIKLRIRREVFQAAEKVKEHVSKSGNDSLENILSTADQIYNEKINLFQNKNSTQPVDLVKDIDIEIEELGNKCDDGEDGISCPYPIYKSLYGNYLPGDLVIYAARAKTGKSTLLSDIAVKTAANPKQNVKILILDTELDTQLVRRRMISSISGVNEFFIRTGLFRKNYDSTEKVRSALKHVKKLEGKIQHIYIGGNADIDNVLSLIRRWFYKEVGRNDGILPLVIFDYIKLSHGEFNNPNYAKLKDYQLAGMKADRLKQIAMELGLCLVSSVQTNRMNESRDEKKKINDGAAISMSDQINALASSIFIMNKCSLEQTAEFQQRYGIYPTHTIQSIYCRNLGQFGADKERVRINDGDKIYYDDNKIFVKIKNFNVEEINDLWSLEEARKDKVDVQIADDHTKNEKLL